MDFLFNGIRPTDVNDRTWKIVFGRERDFLVISHDEVNRFQFLLRIGLGLGTKQVHFHIWHKNQQMSHSRTLEEKDPVDTEVNK